MQIISEQRIVNIFFCVQIFLKINSNNKSFLINTNTHTGTNSHEHNFKTVKCWWFFWSFGNFFSKMARIYKYIFIWSILVPVSKHNSHCRPNALKFSAVINIIVMYVVRPNPEKYRYLVQKGIAIIFYLFFSSFHLYSVSVRKINSFYRSISLILLSYYYNCLL